jgi:uncharacterized membrane protein
MRKIRWSVWILYLIAFLFLGYIVWQFFLHRPQDAPVAIQKKKIINFPWAIWETILYLHILSGVVALVIGPFQFLPISRRYPRLHRSLGKFYVTAIFLSVPAGLYLARYATGGMPSSIGFVALDIVWFVTTFMALKRIRERNVAAHKKWMFRSYAVTCVFVTFRIEMPIFAMAFGFGNGFSIVIWTALLGNLAFAEWCLRKKRGEINRVAVHQ